MGHPNWIEEIQDKLTYPMIEKLKNLSNDFGVLSILIFLRLQSYYNVILNGSK